MGPGVDPHLYNATQGDIKKLDSGDVIFYSGLHLEGNMTEIFEQIGKNKPVLAIADAIPKDQLRRMIRRPSIPMCGLISICGKCLWIRL